MDRLIPIYWLLQSSRGSGLLTVVGSVPGITEEIMCQMKHKQPASKAYVVNVCMSFRYTLCIIHIFFWLIVNLLLFYRYASSKGIRRARIEFKRRKAQFMLYTERIHFYRRLAAAWTVHKSEFGLKTIPCSLNFMDYYFTSLPWPQQNCPVWDD